MASLRKRGRTYYVVFSRRTPAGALQQKAFTLGTTRKNTAEALKHDYQERYARGEIDPFGAWSPRQEAEARRREEPTGTTLEAMAERFLASRSHVRVVTRAEYRRLLDRLLEQIGRTMPVALIDEADIRQFCFRPNLSPASQTTYLRFCKMFFSWLAEEEHTDKNVCRGIRYPKRAETVSEKILTEPQLDVLFRAFKREQRLKVRAGQGRPSRGLHVWLRPLVALLFYSGLRRKEALALRWEQIDLEAGYLHVTETKTGRERVVPIRTALRIRCSVCLPI